mmetsp:Transcript_14916/g.39633  ORF Transcript_14916/g.39633 Transcript_14916/m.39633 type:complete len:638 (+) Transcript_14916:1068-2981(+)
MRQGPDVAAVPRRAVLGRRRVREDAERVARALHGARGRNPEGGEHLRGGLRRQVPQAVALLLCLLRGRLRDRPHRQLAGVPEEGGGRRDGQHQGQAQEHLRRRRAPQGPHGPAHGPPRGHHEPQGRARAPGRGLLAAAPRQGPPPGLAHALRHPPQAGAEDPRGADRRRGEGHGQEARLHRGAQDHAHRDLHRGGQRAALRGARGAVPPLARAAQEVLRVPLPRGGRQAPRGASGHATAGGRGGLLGRVHRARGDRGRHGHPRPGLRLGLQHALPRGAAPKVARRGRLQLPRAARLDPRGGEEEGARERACRDMRRVADGALEGGAAGAPGREAGRRRLRPRVLRGDDGAHEELRHAAGTRLRRDLPGWQALRPHLRPHEVRLPLRGQDRGRLDGEVLLRRGHHAVGRHALLLPEAPQAPEALARERQALRADRRGLAAEHGQAQGSHPGAAPADVPGGHGGDVVQQMAGLLHGLRRAVGLQRRQRVDRRPLPLREAARRREGHARSDDGRLNPRTSSVAAIQAPQFHVPEVLHRTFQSTLTRTHDFLLSGKGLPCRRVSQPPRASIRNSVCSSQVAKTQTTCQAPPALAPPLFSEPEPGVHALPTRPHCTRFPRCAAMRRDPANVRRPRQHSAGPL